MEFKATHTGRWRSGTKDSQQFMIRGETVWRVNEIGDAGYPVSEWNKAGLMFEPIVVPPAVPTKCTGDKVMIRPYKTIFTTAPWWPAHVYFTIQTGERAGHLRATCLELKRGTWEVRHESSGDGATWREPTPEELACHWPPRGIEKSNPDGLGAVTEAMKKAFTAPPVPKTFADVRIGQTWRWEWAGHPLDQTDWTVEAIGANSHRVSRIGRGTVGRMDPEDFSGARWTFVSDPPAASVTVDAVDPMTGPAVNFEKFTGDAYKLEGKYSVGRMVWIDEHGVHHESPVGALPPDPIVLIAPAAPAPTFAMTEEQRNAVVFAAMTEQNAKYTARRAKELMAAKKTFAQEAPLFRHAPMIRGKDW